MEKWVDAIDYPMYEVSDCGRIRNKKTGRILKSYIDKHGYPRLTLRKNKVQYPVKVHRVEATSFYGRHEGMDVNHIDGDKTNNNLSNLEFCTRKENIRHAFVNGLKSPSREMPIMVVETGKTFRSIRECSRSEGYDESAICKCLSGKQDNYKGIHFVKLDE